MGDIKRFKKKFTTPMHPWNATRIKLEKDIASKYGVANKREIWKMESQLKSFKDQAKKLLTRMDEQANKERQQMQERMQRLGLIKSTSGVDEILGLQLRDIMNRRLQTLVFKRRMARSIKHARQLIVHEHIIVADRKITSPSYLVPAADEALLSFAADSAFIKGEHPEAFSADLALKRVSKRRAKDKKRGENSDEIVLFDERTISDPEASENDNSVDASVADLQDAAESEDK